MLKHSGTQTLETMRLLLRQFKVEDAEPAFRNWCNDEKVTRYLTWAPHQTIKVTNEVLKEWSSHYEECDFYQWAIVLKDINEPIGSISIVNYDDQTNAVEIGYCIGQQWWHQGITSEAFSVLIDYFFTVLKANRIQAKHDIDNPRSGSVMKRCGLTYEGTLRQAALSNNGIADVCVYSLLRDEWLKTK
ncbi:MAG: GNAT family N-acetyltransferase [Erysipelotrichaceae bacterium]|nr:GNAT family N-acetyltransferase [Erysipelotrichaceae bacterium]